MLLTKRCMLVLLGSMVLASLKLTAIEQGQRVPDEFESVGGRGLGLGNSAAAAMTDVGAVRSNPAMMALDKQYVVSAGLHWPSVGRDFWQAGAVDSRTSGVAAGLLYSAGREAYKPESEPLSEEDQIRKYYDAPLKYRASGALAQPLGSLAFGVGASYLEGFVPENAERADSKLKLTKGTVYGLGLAGVLASQLYFSASVENLSNTQLRDLAPRIWRGGLSWGGLLSGLSLNLDYRQRERVYQERMPVTFGMISLAPEGEGLTDDEKLVSASFIMSFQNLVQILGSYGEDLSGTKRRTLAGGVAFSNQTLSLSWLAARPYLSDEQVHHAIHLSMQVTI